MMERFIEIDETVRFEVSFSVLNREEGFEDDIRFAIADTAPPDMRMFEANEIGILLTPAQAEQSGRGAVGGCAVESGHTADLMT